MSFFWFLDIEFHILPKIEVKKRFMRFPSLVIGQNQKLRNLGNWYFFLLSHIGKL